MGVASSEQRMAPSGGGFRYAVPRLPRPLAKRGRLLERLDSQVPLVVVRGPVGIGKTTLVAQWIACLPDVADAAWVTLDRDARSADDLWEEVHQALAVTGVLASDADDIGARLAIRRALHAWAAPVILVVEAYERVHGDEAHREIAEMLRQCPNLRVIACTRDDGRLREACRQQGVESDVIDVRDLLLTREETHALFESFGLALPPARLADLHRETGGWPAILWTIGNALAHEPSPWTLPVDEVVRHHAHEWVRSEVLPALAPLASSERVFRMTVPARLDDEVARFVNGGDDPRPVLDCLVSHGLLVSTPTAPTPTYVWPRLVRSALLSLFVSERPQVVRRLDSELADWFRAHGDHAHALAHALAADDLDRAHETVEEGWLSLLAVDQDGLEAFFTRLPAADLPQRPKLRAIHELVESLRGDGAAASEGPVLLGRTELELIGRSSDPRCALDDGLLSLLSLRRHGDLGQARDIAVRLTSIAAAARGASSDHVGDLLCPVFKETGILHLVAGETRAAKEALTWAYETASSSRIPGAARDVSAALALTLAVDGDVAEAEAWIAQHAKLSETSLDAEAPSEQDVSTAMALVGVERLDRRLVKEALERGLRPPEASNELWFHELYARGQVALLWGDRIGMLHRIAAERSRRGRRVVAGSLAEAVVAAVEVDLLISLQCASRASGLLASIESDHPIVDLARARLALVVGDHRTAQRIAGSRRWDDRCSSRVRTDLNLTYTAAVLAGGDEGEALADFGRALSMADGGIYRPFAMIPRDLLTAAAGQLPTLATVVAALDDAHVRDVLPRQLEIVELTPREEVVLAEIATGRTIDDIAQTLHVSVNTIKSQTRSLYRKLGVRSRDEAVHAAAIRGMLDPSR
ncbi:hypothetical protein H4N58_14340 [Mumia sp. ZJ1417]|uniref:LuxR C-terminal-related transcriptional regulator n=1 Tax=Mumia sp. ZJ1417 TaxID=2708082 RepID=UPI00142331B9|nr:LuxR C-terminal-related transcriptional regulator [Mumia sp. ZJ1417]QMW65373.1 hypothetical protein H4N58_14340 [Mumia sp. ZJ1417]